MRSVIFFLFPVSVCRVSNKALSKQNDIAGVDGVASVRKLGRDSLDGSFQHVVTESGTPGIYI